MTLRADLIATVEADLSDLLEQHNAEQDPELRDMLAEWIALGTAELAGLVA